MDFFWHTIALLGTLLPSILGHNLIFGKGKILHFGPVGISILSVYATILVLMATQSFTLALLAGLGISLLASLFFAWLSLRLDPDALGVMTIALHLVALSIVLNWSSLTHGALGIPRIPRLPFLDSVFDFALLSFGICILWILFMWRIDRSAFGRQLAALSEHEWHAESLGIDRMKVHCSAFLIAGAGITIVNFIYPQYVMFISPNDYQFPAFVFMVMAIVAGKPGSVLGVTLSTVLLIVLKEALRFVPLAPSILGPVRLILFGLILFGAVYWRRDVLFPQRRSV
ncbi:MAG TPA: branched-chain amino acid ABC transporter permease [Candidatus Peribacterales bacterium]|nr:branched-chain amino acid ABC transporter permease [Candidatus Peribacterales bacterium]